jgi:hypothetical protein
VFVTNAESGAGSTITLVPTRGAFIVQGRSGKYCVTLFSKESCQCPSTTTCFHILAAKMSIGQEPIEKRPIVNLRLLTKKKRKRVDKKSGWRVTKYLFLYFWCRKFKFLSFWG